MGTLQEARALLRSSIDPAALRSAIEAQLTGTALSELAAVSPSLIDAYASNSAAVTEEMWLGLLRLLLRRAVRSTPFPGMTAVGVADARAPVTSPLELTPRHVEMPPEPLDPPEIHAAVPALRYGERAALLDHTGQVTLIGGAVAETVLRNEPLDAKEDATHHLMRVGVARRHMTTNGIGRAAFTVEKLRHETLKQSATIAPRLGVPAAVVESIRERHTLLRHLAPRGPLQRYSEYCSEFLQRFSFEPVRLSTLCLPERSGLRLPWEMTAPLHARDAEHRKFIEQLFSRCEAGQVQLSADEVLRRPAVAIRSEGLESSVLLFADRVGAWLPNTAPGFFGTVSGCFRTAGRFLAAIPELREHVLAWQRGRGATRDALHAEVVCDLNEETMPLSRRAHAWPYELAVSGPRLSRNAVRISLDELWVRARGDSLIVVNGDDQEVEIHVGHVLAPEQMPTPARLLQFIAQSGPGDVADFSWGERENSLFLPRVQCGPHLISAARWSLAPLAVAPDVFPAALRRWQAEWRVPSMIAVGAYDRVTFVNLDSRDGLRELQRHARQAHAFATEVPWLEEERAHRLFEFVLSQDGRQSDAPPPQKVRRVLPEREAAREWSYLRLPINDAAQRVLMRQLRSTFAEMQGWHFVRYVEGRRPELRLRWPRADDDDATVDTVRECASSLGCEDVVADSYFPERYRYQVEADADVLHAVFHEDSVAALSTWLDVRAGVDVLGHTASALASVAAVLWGAAGAAKAVRATGAKPEVMTPLAFAPTLAPFTGVADTPLHRALELYNAALVKSSRSPAHIERARQSVLHMMCNRRLGPRGDLEFIARGFAHGLLRRHA